jgi:hypothetical protein
MSSKFLAVENTWDATAVHKYCKNGRDIPRFDIEVFPKRYSSKMKRTLMGSTQTYVEQHMFQLFEG